MSYYDIQRLIIDEEFKTLIRPLFKAEYEQLEKNIIKDGCRDPLTTWNGILIDGHNRYSICQRHNIPFNVVEMEFSCRDEVIAWICANQLGRRNLTEETRKFLIGKQYEAEKRVNTQRNMYGHNQFSEADLDVPYESFDPAEVAESMETKRKTAEKIGVTNHISHGTVEKYAIYARALEIIKEVEPKLYHKILSGRMKISHPYVVELSRKQPSEIKKFYERLENNQQPFTHYMESRREMQFEPTSVPQSAVPSPSIKDMPEFDPDADVIGLTLTIPSWVSAIVRTRKKANLSIISDGARLRLQKALTDLQSTISEMQAAIKEH